MPAAEVSVKVTSSAVAAKPYSVVPFAEIDPVEWDNLVQRSPEGWLYQTTPWIGLAGITGSVPLCFGIRSQSGHLVALLPLYREDPFVFGPFRLRRVHTGLSGPVLEPLLTSKVRLTVWKQLFAAVDQIAEEQHADLFQVRLTNVAPAYQPDLRPSVNPLFSVGMASPLTLDLMHTWQPLSRVMMLEKPEEQLLKEMDGDCRAAVRQAQRGGVSVHVSDDRSVLNEFTALHAATWNRTGLKAHDQMYFEAMWDRFHDKGSMRVLFAQHEGKRIAGVIVHLFKDAALYWAGCSQFAALKLRPNNLLLWEAILDAKKCGKRCFEIGYFYAAPGPSAKEYNIGKYKSQFGVDTIVPLEGQRVYRPAKLVTFSFLRDLKEHMGRHIKRMRTQS